LRIVRIRTPGRLLVALAAAVLGAALCGPAHAQALKGEDAPLAQGAQTPAPWAEPAPIFGAIAFTADGSFSAAWKSSSKTEVEAKVRDECNGFRRGKCEVVTVPKGLCAAIATYHQGSDRKVTYAGGGLTRADAQRAALERCTGGPRSGRTCQLRTVVCADGG
jgi:hypothetical protein